MMPETNPAMNLFFCFACRRTLLSCLRDFYCPQSYAFFSDKRNVLKKKFFNLSPVKFSEGARRREREANRVAVSPFFCAKPAAPCRCWQKIFEKSEYCTIFMTANN